MSLQMRQQWLIARVDTTLNTLPCFAIFEKTDSVTDVRLGLDPNLDK